MKSHPDVIIEEDPDAIDIISQLEQLGIDIDADEKEEQVKVNLKALI